MTPERLARLDREEFLSRLGPVFENAPWVAEVAWEARPFADLAALHRAMLVAVRARPEAEIVRFLQGHPDLAGKAARAGEMTAHSVAEQAGAGLDRMSDEEFDRFGRLNAAYRARFGFPFVVCVANHDKASILAAFERRLANDRAAELQAALAEVAEIARHRLAALDDRAATAPGRS